jgi:uncharacterized protein YoxC
MDHSTPTTDTDALMAEVDALLEQVEATDARVDALLASWAPRPAADTTTAVRRLQRTARLVARLSALVERQQSALTAQLDAIEAG